MVRTQIYLTEVELRTLHKLMAETGKSQSELIREAIDHFLESLLSEKQNKLSALHAAKGMWADRDDLLDFSAIRKEWDRNL